MKRLILILALVGLTLPAPAAVTFGIQWDVRTGGASTNGGGFDLNGTSCGTDESQQNSGTTLTLTVQATTTQATSSPAITSTTHGPCNVVNITAGAGCVTGRHVLNSQSGGTGTFNDSLGSNGNTCTATMGGALDGPASVEAAAVALNTAWFKQGTFTVTTAVSVVTGSINRIGYVSTHGDSSTPVTTITTATNSIRIYDNGSGAVSGFGSLFANFIFTNTAGTPGHCFEALAGNWTDVAITNSSFSGCSVGIYGDYSVNFSFGLLVLTNVEIKNSTSHGIVNSYPLTLQWCWLHGNTGDGFHVGGQQQISGEMVVENTVISGNAYGIWNGNSTGMNRLKIDHSAISGNTNDGILSTPWIVSRMTNTVLYNNGGYAWNSTVAQTSGYNYFQGANNALGSNTTGTYHNVTEELIGTADIALGACNPFTSTSNFALSSCGKTALKALAFPGAGTFGTGYATIGPLELQSAGGGGGGFFIQ